MLSCLNPQRLPATNASTTVGHVRLHFVSLRAAPPYRALPCLSPLCSLTRLRPLALGGISSVHASFDLITCRFSHRRSLDLPLKAGGEVLKLLGRCNMEGCNLQARNGPSSPNVHACTPSTDIEAVFFAYHAWCFGVLLSDGLFCCMDVRTGRLRHIVQNASMLATVPSSVCKISLASF